MFNLHNQLSVLNNVNVRAENHGEDKVLGIDLKLSLTLSNDVLGEFDPDLKTALFKVPETGQEELDLEEATRLSALKFPSMGSIGWGSDLKGYKFKLHYGIGGEQSDVILQDCKVNSFRFTPKEGGSVEISVRVQANPQLSDMPKVLEYLGREATIDLLPPEEQEPEQQELKEAA